MPTADAKPVAADSSGFPARKFTDVPVMTLQRATGLAIVLLVAFGGSVVTSALRVVGVRFDYSDTVIGYRYFETLIHQLTALALLFYVVWQNRQSLADLGIVFRGVDIVYGVLLWAFTDVSYRLAFPTIISTCEFLGWHKAPPYYPSTKLGLGLITFCFVLINPIYEELIVRAFLISEVVALTGSSTLAILASVGLQTSYHLYQGLPYALALGVDFLIFSLYYARTRRVLPVILAHFIMDMSFVLSFRPV